MRKYKAQNGETQFMPSVKEAMAGNALGEGFCLACGVNEPNVEPDAVRYRCSATTCGESKVYGFEALVLKGLVHD